VIFAGVYFGLTRHSTGSLNSFDPLPYLTPPVRAACPVGLKGVAGSSGNFRTLSLDPGAVLDRFFNPLGSPTDLFTILGTVDSRVQGINQRLDCCFPCMSNTPVNYTLSTWGTNVEFAAQCSEGDAANGFDQWGVVGNVFYLYSRRGDGVVAAQITSNATDGSQAVSIWFSVGTMNRNGSHGVVQLLALPSEQVFEMSVAGSSIGYCGAQLKSNNATMNVTGSTDMGTTCNPTDSVCTSAANVTTIATCSASCSTFTLPALGRQAYGGGMFGASMYPGGSANQVVLTTTGNDATFFGPSSPTV